MHGDFAVNPLAAPEENVARVLMQQGRPLLPADWNTQVAVNLRQMRQFIVDLIGHHAGKAGAFEFTGDAKLVRLGFGFYYVDGIRVENVMPADGDPKKGLLLSKQPYLANASDAHPTEPGITYLDVWERHVSAAEDDQIREVALGGPDTTSRSIVIWQVKFFATEQAVTDETAYDFLKEQLGSKVLLAARARYDSSEDDPCRLSPDAQYRGAENQLYRVEIHSGLGETNDQKPTFKWARDNGSNVLPIASYTGGDTVELESLGRDRRTGLAEGDWVEVVDDTSVLSGDLQPLLRVKKVDRPTKTAILIVPAGTVTRGTDASKHPILRRWDGPLRDVEERTDADDFMDLADGIQIQFASPPDAQYRPGDYWLIPARTITGDVIWPRTGDVPDPQRPHGVDHHYGPLFLWKDGVAKPTDLRFEIQKIVK